MYFRIALLAAVGSAACITIASAQNPPAATVRTVIAATKFSLDAGKPLYFRAVNITVAPGAQHELTSADGILYQVSGSAEAAVGGEAKKLAPGEGLFIGAGKSATLKAGSEPVAALHFLLESAPGVAAASAAEKELFRTPAPLAGLKPGSQDLNLTRVTFPAGMASNPPHHRTGAALYVIVSGTGANTIAGKTEPKGPGAVIFEPSGLVHQWGNPGETPLTFLTFNINREGEPAVAPDVPARSQ